MKTKPTMKNSILFFLIFISMNSFSQNFNVQSAADSYKDLQYAKTDVRRLKDFSDAKKFIDLAAANEQTANDPKMWSYRVKIYMEMDADTSSVIKSLDPDAIEKATQSLIGCIKADTKKNYSEECEGLIPGAGMRLFNKAAIALNQGDLNKAEKYYNLTLDVIPFDKDHYLKKDSITPDVINYYLARGALRLKNDSKAKDYLQKLIDAKYNDPMIYLYMEKVYLDEKDTLRALEYIVLGQKVFVNDPKLLSEEIRIYSLQGKTDMLIAKLTEAINLKPDNEILYDNRGLLYHHQKDFAKAEADYKKALELKPGFMDANYNLGSLYFNQAAELANAANSIKNNDEFDKAKKKYEAKFKEAAPYLEKSLELNPQKTEDDQALYKGTLNSLKQLYARTGEMEKYNKIKALQEQK
jgi:tetratricopeptide (TPR) repeat protein